MGLLIEFVVTSIAEFVGWLAHDLWKEWREERRLKRQGLHSQSGPIWYD